MYDTTGLCSARRAYTERFEAVSKEFRDFLANEIQQLDELKTQVETTELFAETR